MIDYRLRQFHTYNTISNSNTSVVVTSHLQEHTNSHISVSGLVVVACDGETSGIIIISIISIIVIIVLVIISIIVIIVVL